MEKKEERIRRVALSYYSRRDVLEAMFKFSQNRETIPLYFEGFGKRPDSFHYPSDILSLVKKGATSFHCSEELWDNPLELSTELNESQLNGLRKGWDLIIDIDCKWIDYSKKAAIAIIKSLEYKKVRDIGIKFSGSKGFHIVVPWQAFPEYIGEIKTKEMFPEWPRAIINYLKEVSRPVLQGLIKDMGDDFAKVEGYTGIRCESCNNLASENFQISLRCSKYHPPHIEIFKSSTENYKKRKCPNCNSNLEEVKREKFYVCNRCNLDSLENKSNFNKAKIATDVFKVLGLDLLLVSSRHLFRMPYSLHEKTALASVVIDKEKIEEFNIKDADPMNARVLEFYPNANPGEAKNLLMEAIDFQKDIDREKEGRKPKYERAYKGEFEKVDIRNVKDEHFPPAIQKILKGMADGRKRALFILINFFRSLGMSIEELEKKINGWNKLNKPPLNKGYIDSQLIWHSKHKPVLPPNFDNEIYKSIGVYEMDDLSMKVKNPVNYVVIKSRGWRKGS